MQVCRLESDRVVIALVALEDTRLSTLARLVHVYAVTRPGGWEWHNDRMARVLGCSRAQLYRALTELELYGYLERAKGSRYGDVEYTWLEQPGKPEQVWPSEVEAHRGNGDRRGYKRERAWRINNE